jgi:hypothetical protein
LWLNDFGLDIRCVRMHPYISDGKTFLDVQTVIPIPEIADYQVRIREKKQKERESRETARDFTRFDVKVAGQQYTSQSKRWMMFRVISQALKRGTPQQVAEAISWQRNRLFEEFDGHLSPEEVQREIMKNDSGGAVPRWKRYFCNDGELFYFDNKTFVLSNQWGARTLEAIDSLKNSFPSLAIEIAANDG